MEISDAGRQRLAIEKQTPAAIEGSLLGASAGEIEVGEPIAPHENEGVIFFLTDDNWAEVDSLACNMETIERYTSSTTPSSPARTRISRASRTAST